MKDKKVADAICHFLEEKKIKCWIAPRDILPGHTYTTEIVKAIKGCKLFLLVMSSKVNNSEHVKNEIQIAINNEKLVIQFKIENVQVKDELYYFLKRKHWIDAFPNPKESFNQLHEQISFIFSDISIKLGNEATQIKTRANDERNEITSNKQNFSEYFDVFISYKSEDVFFAEYIFNLLKINGHNPFLSNKSLPVIGTSEYLQEIYKAIDKTKHFILVLSNLAYLESKWVKAEWTAFINEKLSGRKKGNLITIVSNKIDISSLPLELRQYQSHKIEDLAYKDLKYYLK